MNTADLKIDVSLTTRLEKRAAATCAKLVDLCKGSNAIATELRAKFLAAISDVEHVTIEALAAEHGAFLVDEGWLRVSEEPVAKLLMLVLEDIRGRAADDPDGRYPDEIPELLERVFVDYVLHELRHRTQGIGDYDTVQRLKEVGGARAVAELDVFADRDAAFAYATLHATGDSRVEFLASFQEALFLSSAYFFRVFRPSADRPDQLARAIAVLLMAARLSSKELTDPIVECDDLPLDAPLFVTLSLGKNQLAIYKAEPNKKLLAVAKDSGGDGVSEIVADVGAGDFESALEKSVTLMGRLNLL